MNIIEDRHAIGFGGVFNDALFTSQTFMYRTEKTFVRVSHISFLNSGKFSVKNRIKCQVSRGFLEMSIFDFRASEVRLLLGFYERRWNALTSLFQNRQSNSLASDA